MVNVTLEKPHLGENQSKRILLQHLSGREIIYSNIYFSNNDCTRFLEFRVHLEFRATSKMYGLYGLPCLNFFFRSSKILPRIFSSKNVPLLYHTDCTEQYNLAESKCLENYPAPWDLCPLEKKNYPWDSCPLEKNYSSLSLWK